MNKESMPVFVVCGALGVGKSTISQILIARKSDKYIILKGDLCNFMAFPEVLSDCRKAWVDVCFDVANQTNRAVVFYADLYPDAFCAIDKEKYKHMYFASLVCDDEELKKRIESRHGEASNQKMPGTDGTWCDMSLLRNQVYSGRTKYQYPEMDRLETTGLSAEQSADLLDQWITRILANY